MWQLRVQNMAGKSTFLRQVAIIAVLAQAGAYVPADAAHVGVLDRLYSRVGARDELDRDRSTFMIEMDEATTILDGATDRSLVRVLDRHCEDTACADITRPFQVLLDELGRGTSPIDGLAIAYAALEHLTHANRSRTLFATHYHRLGQLLGYREHDSRGSGEWAGVEFWCTDVEESDVRTPLHSSLSEIRRSSLTLSSVKGCCAVPAHNPPRAES